MDMAMARLAVVAAAAVAETVVVASGLLAVLAGSGDLVQWWTGAAGG